MSIKKIKIATSYRNQESASNAMLKLYKQVIALAAERQVQGRAEMYKSLREAMADMHFNWQRFIDSVRAREDVRNIMDASTNLAAVSMKVAIDIQNFLNQREAIETYMEEEVDPEVF